MGGVRRCPEYHRTQSEFDQVGDWTGPHQGNIKCCQEPVVRKTPAVPERDRWRLGYLAKMLEARGETFYAGKETELVSILIDSLCSS